MKIYQLIVLALIVVLSSCKSNETLVQSKYNSLPEIDIEQQLAEALKANLPSTTDTVKPSIAEIINIKPLEIEFEPLPSPLSLNVINKAFDYRGVRYRRGGMSTKGFDCSGFVLTCFSQFGVSLPRTSIEMSKAVEDVSKNEAQKGDLIFFTTNRSKRINHVGIVVEVNNNDIKFIHASTSNGVIVSSTNEPYYANSYAKVGRVATA